MTSKDEPTQHKIAYSVPEVARLISTGTTTVYKLINSGELPAKKLGDRTLILHDDLIRFMNDLPYFHDDDQ